MRYIKTYENFIIKEEKTWHWLATAAVLITNLILNKIEESGDAKKAKTEIKQMFSSAKELYYPEIDSAKKYVIDKVLNSPDFKNKEEIINKINSIKFIESPMGFGDSNPGYLCYNDNGLNLEYVILTKSIFDSLPSDYKKMALRHELMHLVDCHEYGYDNWSINSKDKLDNFSVSDLSEDQYNKIHSQILNNDTLKFGEYLKSKFINFDDKKKYLTSPEEMFTRINNLKFFLVKSGFLKSTNDDITEKMWDDIYSGELFKSITDEDLIDDLLVSDFLEVLPFIKNSKIDKLNKIAYLYNKNKKNIV